MLRFDTPRRLRGIVAGHWLVAVVILVTLLSTSREHDAALRAIADDAAPSVVAAHHVKIEIESLDADLINEMLVAENKDAWASDFTNNRNDLGKHLIAATRSPYGNDEDAPIERLQESLGRYLMAVQAARDAHHRGEDAIPAYLDSYHVLDRELIPAARDLDRVSNTALDRSYNNQEHHSKMIRILLVLLGVLAVLALLTTQVYFARTFRRSVSPALLAATLLTLALVIYARAAIAGYAADLQGLKVDSYDSVDALLNAKADAYEANSAESRWLLDRSEVGSAEHAGRFAEYVDKVAKPSPGSTLADIDQIAQARNRRTEDLIKAHQDPARALAAVRADLPLHGDGSLVKALDNLTFPEEPEWAESTFHAFTVYVGLDAKLRELELSNKHADAVSFDVGMDNGDSNWAFAQFDKALDRWTDINVDWMNRYHAAAAADVKALPAVAIALTILIIGLVGLGAHLRLREYR